MLQNTKEHLSAQSTQSGLEFQQMTGITTQYSKFHRKKRQDV